MKTEIIVTVYREINNAKLSKMDDKDKFLMIKVMKSMKPVAAAFEDFVKDAQEKLKDEKFEAMQKEAREWQEKGVKCTFSEEKKIALNRYFADYNQKVADCVKEESEKENELTYERLSEDAFGKFIASNDFDVKTIMALEDVLM